MIANIQKDYNKLIKEIAKCGNEESGQECIGEVKAIMKKEVDNVKARINKLKRRIEKDQDMKQ